MTARQKEMATIQKQIAELAKEIGELGEKFDYLSNLPDSPIEDELLYTMDDFPRYRHLWGALCDEANVSSNIYLTVKDLISCSEENLSSYNGLGKATMERLKNWMAKYDLHFVG